MMREFARGVKLTTNHLTDPTGALATDLGNASLSQKQQKVPTRFHWTVDQLTSRMFETSTNRVCLPFIIPPFQQDFDPTTYRVPQYRLVLSELSISWDQRAEPYAIVDPYAAAPEGYISNADMTRLTITLKLCEKTPTRLGGLATDRSEVMTLEIPGVEAYGDPTFRQNPLLVDGLYIPLHPFKTYWWEVSVPGLFKAPPADDTLALPSFTIHVRCLSPLVARDTAETATEVQNLPTSHKGLPQTSTITMPTIAVDSLINGDTDLQQTFGTLDDVMLDRLRSGYGDTPGMESDVFPAEHLAEDSAYSVIVVPMWQGFKDLRASEVPTAGLPYVAAPWTDPSEDRRLLAVPEGFVLHHAFAVWSLNAPPCPLTGGNVAWGTYPSSATFLNRVGVILHNGVRGDNFRYQEVAYTSWQGNGASTSQIDTYSPDPTGTIPNFWAIQHIPLVSDNVGVQKSFYLTGKPFYMGRSTDKTADRTVAGNMPALYGGAAYATPLTEGAENTLEIRWRMVDATQGLNHPAEPDAVRIGCAGHWVVLVGKATLHA